MQKSLYGSLAFSLAFLIAVFLGIIGAMSSSIAWFLIGLGVVVGVMTWLWNDPLPVLAAAGAIALLAHFPPGSLINANTFLNILDYLAVVFMPVAIINAVKLVFEKAQK